MKPQPRRPKPENFKPCSWHVRLGVASYCSTDCIKWRESVDAITAGEVAALDNRGPESEE